MDIFFKIFSLSFTLFLLMDSIGNIPLFIAILKDFDPKIQKRIIRRELFIALGIIIFFHFLGTFLLNLIQVKQETILIAGGIILFLISINMVFHSNDTKNKSTHTETPLIVPLAIPLVAGPAVLAAVMIYAEQESQLVALSSIAFAWIASAFILTSATHLKKLLGSKGILACEKLMGLLLILISIQMCLQGIELYIIEIKKALL